MNKFLNKIFKIFILINNIILRLYFIEDENNYCAVLRKRLSQKYEHYTKCGGFDKLNHRNASLLDNPFRW